VNAHSSVCQVLHGQPLKQICVAPSRTSRTRVPTQVCTHRTIGARLTATEDVREGHAKFDVNHSVHKRIDTRIDISQPGGDLERAFRPHSPIGVVVHAEDVVDVERKEWQPADKKQHWEVYACIYTHSELPMTIATSFVARFSRRIARPCFDLSFVMHSSAQSCREGRCVHANPVSHQLVTTAVSCVSRPWPSARSRRLRHIRIAR
jgi:hypothetical protein